MGEERAGRKVSWVTRLDVLGTLVLAGLFFAWVGVVIVRQNMAGEGVEVLRAAAEEPYRIDLNRASRGELMLLKGIGEKRAERIVSAREKNGGFSSVEDARKAAGMTRREWERVAPMVRVGEEGSGAE